MIELCRPCLKRLRLRRTPQGNICIDCYVKQQELVKRKCPKHGLWVCEKCVWAYGFNESQDFTGKKK